MSAVDVHYEVSPGPDGRPERPGAGATAQTFVLSNSLGSTLAMWDGNVGELARHGTVVRYDTRGHGKSPVPAGPYSIDDLVDDVVALIDRLGLKRVHFAGLSLGGMVGMRLAAREPEKVDRLAVLCTGARLEPSSGWTERAATVRAGGAGAVASAVVARWYTEGYRSAQPEVTKAAEAMVAATPTEGYAGCCEVIAAMDLRPDLRRISAPTLAIAGADDPATPPAQLQAIAEGVQHGKLVVIPDAAHLANDEQRETVNSALLAHFVGSER